MGRGQVKLLRHFAFWFGLAFMLALIPAFVPLAPVLDSVLLCGMALAGGIGGLLLIVDLWDLERKRYATKGETKGDMRDP